MRTARELFEELNAQDESATLEAKGAHELGRAVLETVCAFANEPDMGGGYLIIGAARENSSLFPSYVAEHIDDTDKVQSDLATQCNTAFNIPIRPKIVIESVNNNNVMVVQIDEVSPGQKPVYFKDKPLPQSAYRRIGPTDHKCSEDDLRIFYSDENDYDRSVLTRTSSKDIDENAIAQYRRLRAEINAAAEELSYSDEELLIALGCLDHQTRKHLTIAGLLLFGTRMAQRRELPMVRADYIRVPGKEWIKDPDDRFRTTDMRGPLISLMYRLVEEINADLPKGFMLAEGQLQAKTSGLPVKALREVIVNALMHRNYRENSPIQVIRYDNRIEIRNPGYSLKNEELLGTPGSKTRNPIIAAVFHDTNLAETKGSGIRAIKRLLKSAHLAPPTFESDRVGNQFTAHLLLHHFLSEGDLVWLSKFEKFELNDDQKQALILVRELGAINNSSYRQILDIDTLEATRDLRQLCEYKLLLKKGEKKGTYYLPGKRLNEEPRIHSDEPKALIDEPKTLSDEPKALSDEPKALIDEPIPNDNTSEEKRNNLLRELPDSLAKDLLSLKKRESNKEKIADIIVEVCSIRPFTLSELSILLNKGDNYISNNYIKPLLGTKLNYKFPDVVNHPEQAYIAL